MEPSPSWPRLFAPQQYAAPVVVRAQVWSRPGLIWENVNPPVTPTGTDLAVVDPSPSSPQGFPPQQYGAPLVVSAQVCVAPALTEAKLTTVTVMPAVSLTPSLDAITPAEPALTPVTRPFASTDATAASSVVQVIGRLRITLRFA